MLFLVKIEKKSVTLLGYKNSVPGEFLFVLVPHHLKQIEMILESRSVNTPQSIDHLLQSQHQKLVTNMQTELHRMLKTKKIKEIQISFKFDDIVSPSKVSPLFVFSLST